MARSIGLLIGLLYSFVQASQNKIYKDVVTQGAPGLVIVVQCRWKHDGSMGQG